MTAPPCDDVLVVTGLHKRYGRGRRAVHASNDIALTVAAGEVFGLLGHNGAGKTTLVNQIVGLIRPDAGSIRLDGVDAIARPAAARNLAAVQAQANVPITGLTPVQAIELVGRIRGGRPSQVRARARGLIDALDLGAWARTPAQRVSGGIARLTAFAMAVVVPGRLVILDEPTNDVDPVRRRLLWDQIRALADEGVAVLLVTHNVREAERAVDRLAVLDRGRVLACGTPRQLLASHGSDAILDVEPGAGGMPPAPPWLDVLRSDATHVVYAVQRDDMARAVKWAHTCRQEGTVGAYSLEDVSLEDVYIALTTQPTAETQE